MWRGPAAALLLFCLAITVSEAISKRTFPASVAPEAEEGPIVEVGGHYQVAWSCEARIGCYAEILRVDKIRHDGWFDVFQCIDSECLKGERWAVRLERANAIRPILIGRLAH